MAFDIANPIGTGTDAELLVLTRAAIAEVTAHGWSRTIQGRALQMEQLDKLWKQHDKLEARISSESTGAGAKTNYANRQRPL